MATVFAARDANDWYERNVHVDTPNLDLLSLLSKIPEDRTPTWTLEVGCGTGRNLDHLPGLGVDGTEISKPLVERLARERSGHGFRYGYAHRLPYQTGSYHLVVACHVLMYVPARRLLQSLGELVRVSSRWIAIVDYGPDDDRPYEHREGLFAYHRSYLPVLEQVCTLEHAFVRDDAEASLWQVTDR